MASTEERKGRLVILLAKSWLRGYYEEAGPMTVAEAEEMVSVLAEFCKSLPPDLNVSFAEVFDVFQELLPGENWLAFDRAVSKFGQSMLRTEDEPVPAEVESAAEKSSAKIDPNWLFQRTQA